jgi:hypothetical protein
MRLRRQGERTIVSGHYRVDRHRFLPKHSSAFFKDVNREVRTIPGDLAKVPAIGQRHGIEFTPAPNASGSAADMIPSQRGTTANA